VLKENRSSSRFQVYWRWGKLAPFRFSTPLCTIRPYTARPSCKTLFEKCTEQNHSIDVLITRLFSILFWFNPVIWLYQKAILSEFIADSEALLKISDKKAYQITL
jgi:hypothetical protein